jgi:transposase
LAAGPARAGAASAGGGLTAERCGSSCFCWPERGFRDSLRPMDAAALARENAILKARLSEVEAALAEAQEAQRRLEDILRASQRERFGKRSEKLFPDQFNLPLEDAELAQACSRPRRRRPRRRCGAQARRRPASQSATADICRRICPGSSG